MNNYDDGKFGTVDFFVFAASLAASLAIGIFFAYDGRKQNTTNNYMFGNKNMAAWPVSISMAVTYISAVTVLAFPVEVYLYGGVFVWAALGTALGVCFAAQYYVPMYYNLQINTVYEYLEMRFNRPLRLVVSAMAMVQYVFYMGVASYLPSLAVSAVTPLSLNASIAITTVICTVYTTLGGMKAVIWTDVVQGLIMLLGCSSVIFKVTMIQGGVSQIWEAISRGGRNNFMAATFDPRVRANLPAFVFGYFLVGFSGSGTSQPLVQRYISCGNVKVAKRACYYKLIPATIFKVIAVLTGLCMYAYFEGCDPYKAGVVEKADQSVPLLVVTAFKDVPGFAGLFVAAAYSGTLSTVSSGLNSVSTVIVKDYIYMLKPGLKESAQLTLTKIFSLVTGALVGIVAFLCTKLKGTIVRILLTALAANAGPLFSIYAYAFMPFISTKGAIGSFIFSTAFSWWIAIGTLTYSPDPTITRKLNLSIDQCNFTTSHMVEQTSLANTSLVDFKMDDETLARPILADTLYSITPYLLKPMIVIVTLLVGTLISLVTGANKTSEANPDLFIPLVSSKRLPKSVVKFFRFGVPERERSFHWKKATFTNGIEMDDEKNNLKS